MLSTTSADGTTLAYDKAGTGPAVLVIGGGPTTRVVNAELTQLLAATCTVYNYDRRGHGDSGDTAPFHVDREYEDVQAMLDVAGGGDGGDDGDDGDDGDGAGGQVAVFGSSGGAVIALEAAARGLPISRLALWEPSYVVAGTRPPVGADYATRLAALTDAGRPGDAGELFFTEAVGLPQMFIDGMKQSPFWPELEALAPTLVYDAELMGDFSVPAERLGTLDLPVLIVDGATTPWLSTSADTAAAAIPHATRATLPGQQHNVEPSALVPAIAGFLAGDA